jgi:ABC-2 type transport system permease protein
MLALFYSNFIMISHYIHSGDLDLLLTKPVSLQFVVTCRYINIGLAIPNLLAGGIMMGVACVKLRIRFSLIKVLGFMLTLANSVALTYALLLFLSMLSFWLIKTRALDELTYALWDFNNMPMHIYSKPIQVIGIFIIPIFVISNFPCMYMLGQINALSLAWSFLAGIFMMALTRRIWHIAIKKYYSACS